MTSCVRYLTHPEVLIDSSVPVPMWGLSEVGKARTKRATKAGWLNNTTRIISSGERKAIETANIIGAALDVTIEVRDAMHENDRSATGFLSPAEFEVVADRFFAEPAVNVRGWERAIDAQSRIVREVKHVLGEDCEGDVLPIGHGGVGTLLLCHYAGLPISRFHDQAKGGGCYFTFARDGRRLMHMLRRMEDSI